jgi:hypothetical protein
LEDIEMTKNDIDFHGIGYGSGVGRSDGWAMIAEKRADGKIGRSWTSEDVESWDAIMVAKWAKFALIARQAADDVPYQYLSLLYLNVFLPHYGGEDQLTMTNEEAATILLGKE